MVQASHALIACDAQGTIVASRTFSQIEQQGNERASVDATQFDAASQVDAIASLTAHVDIETSARLLAFWCAKQAFLPLHARWDAALRARVLAQLVRVGQSDDVDWLRAAEAHALPRGLAFLMPTSGSTGTPKLACFTRASVEAALAAHREHLGWQPEDRWLLALPTAHIGGLSILLRCFDAGATVVLPPKDFEPSSWRAVIDAQRVTLLSLVPTQLRAFVDEGKSAPQSVRAVLVGGADCPDALYSQARDLGWPLLRTYGSTEGCSQLATERIAGQGLRPLPGVQFECGADGRLSVRAPQLFSGYLGERMRDPELSFRTEDLGHIARDGTLTLLGRADAMIITGGENVAPALVEARLRALSMVHDACVVGIDDAHWGQVVAALLVVSGEMSAVAFEQAQQTWPAHLRVRRFLQVDALPLGVNGKVDRLRARMLLGQKP